MRVHGDLDVYRRAFEAAMDVFDVSKAFPKDERYSITDRMRRCSRSVAATFAEAWRERRYRAAFISKLSDAETEAAETQVGVEFVIRSAYADRDRAAQLYKAYEAILATLVGMISYPDTLLLDARD